MIVMVRTQAREHVLPNKTIDFLYLNPTNKCGVLWRHVLCVLVVVTDSHSHSDSSESSSTLTNEETSWDETSPEMSVAHRRLKCVCLTPPSGSSTTSPDGNEHEEKEERDEERELALQRTQGAIPKRIPVTPRRTHDTCEYTWKGRQV